MVKNSNIKPNNKKKKANTSIRKKIKGKRIRIRKRVNPRALVIIIFLLGVLLIFSSYAWLSASLNVKVKFFDLSVSTDNGLFISLDGIKFSDSVEISVDSLINDLKRTYPSNTNQWAGTGLWPVSSNGIPDNNSSNFSVFIGEMVKNKKKVLPGTKLLNTVRAAEDRSTSAAAYIAFDMFLKNVSGSPNSDNLYFDEDTLIDFDYEKYEQIAKENEEYIGYDPDTGEEVVINESSEEIMQSMENIMNSMRIGIVKIGSVPLKSTVNNIQNIKCNNTCEMVIYEPNSTLHSDASIEKAVDYKITLEKDTAYPTYGVIAPGKSLVHTNGHEGTGVPLDTEHFALQSSITSFTNPIFEIPNGVTKMRVYVWIEGQDVDSLETSSKGAAISIALNLIKDLAGYN